MVVLLIFGIVYCNYSFVIVYEMSLVINEKLKIWKIWVFMLLSLFKIIVLNIKILND